MLVTDSRFHFHVTEHFSRFENCLQTFCRKRFHPLWQTCDFDTVLNNVDHITLACGSIIVLKCFVEFFDMCFADHSHTLHLVVLKKSLLSITTVLVLRSHTRSVK